MSGVAFAPSGNVVVVGTIQGAFDASLGRGDAGILSESDGFVAEFDHSGDLIWVHHWANPNFTPPDTGALSVAINNKHVSVLGRAAGGVIDLDGGRVSVARNPQGRTSTFAVQYDDATGSFLSAASVSSCDLPQCDLFAIASDDDGNTFSLSNISSASSPQSNVVLTKFDTEGRLLWSVPAPNGSIDARLAAGGHGMSAVFGNFELAVFGADGAQQWSRAFHWASPFGQAAFNDSSGEIIVAGTFAGEIDLGGPTPLESPAHDLQVSADNQAHPVFIVKYDVTGNHLWSHAYGNTPRAQSTIDAIRIVPNEDVLFSGAFAGAIDFGAGAFRTTSDPREVGYHDPFLVRLSPDGSLRKSDGFTSSGFGSTGSALAVALDGRVAMGGCFDRSIDFGNGVFISVGTYLSQFGPSEDGFVAVFAP